MDPLLMEDFLTKSFVFQLDKYFVFVSLTKGKLLSYLNIIIWD